MGFDSPGPFTWAAQPRPGRKPALIRMAVTLALLTMATVLVERLASSESFLARTTLARLWQTTAPPAPGAAPDTIADDETRHRATMLAHFDTYERRHRDLTIGATLLHAAIALAAVAIIAGGRRTPWRAAMLLGLAGLFASALAYAA